MMGERIAAVRQSFNLGEGLCPQDFRLPGRVIGDPPLEEGPVAKITVDAEALTSEYYKALDWDPGTGKPSKEKLQKLGLEDVAKEIRP